MEWKQLLLNLSKRLDRKNVNDLVLIEGIPAGDAEQISGDGLKLLQYFERNGTICPEKPGRLLKMLGDIKRNDLKKYVREFGNREISAYSNVGVQQSDYMIKGSPCGLCLIISNQIFDRKGNISHDRDGTLVDEKSLTDTFGWLGFKVELKRNCSADGIYQAVKCIADKDHRKYNAFVCCILTHGNQGEVYGTDWKPMEIAKITSLFEERICRSLAGKPKIFLIQACRGKDQDIGHRKLPTESSECISFPDDERGVGQSFDEVHAEADEKGNDGCSPGADKETCCGSNFYLVYPSVQGHRALLDKTKGSWLISSICCVLQQEACTSELRSMMLNVKKSIAIKESSKGGRYKATPEIHDNLAYQNIYFQPSMSYQKYSSRQYNASKNIETND